MPAQRRLFLAVLAGFSLGAAVGAQPHRKVWRIGFLSAAKRPASIDEDRIGGFPRGMRQLGYVEGDNLSIEWRFADGDSRRLADMANELVQGKVDVVVTAGVPPTLAMKRATATIPIVMGTATDPLGSGLIASLAHPGGNITGMSNVAVDIGPKHLQMLRETVPGLSRVCVLVDPGTASHPAILKSIEGAAVSSNVAAMSVEAGTPAQIERAFTVLTKDHAGAVIVPLSPLFNQQTKQIAQLSLQNRLPSIAGLVEYARAGGLLSYGQNLADHYFRAAAYVDKIIKGANPGDLPIEQPTVFEMGVNRATAAALGIALPSSLLIRADFVIG